jgi:hypothetical protein
VSIGWQVTSFRGCAGSVGEEDEMCLPRQSRPQPLGASELRAWEAERAPCSVEIYFKSE